MPPRKKKEFSISSGFKSAGLSRKVKNEVLTKKRQKIRKRVRELVETYHDLRSIGRDKEADQLYITIHTYLDREHTAGAGRRFFLGARGESTRSSLKLTAAEIRRKARELHEK